VIDLAKLKAANAARWTAMHADPALGTTLDKVAARLIDPAAKARYETVAAAGRQGIGRADVLINERAQSVCRLFNLRGELILCDVDCLL
jgi:hypothetical protein